MNLASFSTSFAKESAARWSKNAVNGKNVKEKREKNKKGKNSSRGFAERKRKRSKGVKKKRLAGETKSGKLLKEQLDKMTWSLFRLKG